MEEIIFPNQIRMLRRVSGKTMQELATFLGVSLSAISKIEKGYRRIDQEQLVKISDFLDCQLQDVFVSEASSQPDVVQSWRREQERRNSVNESRGLKVLGAGLRHVRGQKSLTLSDVADGAGLTLSVYHRIEMGQREVSEEEFANIAKSIGFNDDDLCSQIYELDEKGALEEFIQRNDNRNRTIGISGFGDLSINAISKTPVDAGAKIKVYGQPGKDGAIIIDKDASTGEAACPERLALSSETYGLNLCTRRLGQLLPSRSILLVDPSQMVGSGDIAVYFESKEQKNAKIISVRENMDGVFYGVLWNPDEKFVIDEKQLSELHRVVFISIP